ncbi:copper resistance protein NlpE N-terminal domain-containing protein [Acinetobacter tandoii]|jgi:uncharacterized lipoprotein NlpE involved in copper resistance|uniref:copper resistance protein NlpE N-terminal domain-containing protein n=1 Tax=Acinetobacter tandoii TaxID=202954 RepID=UPI003018190E
MKKTLLCSFVFASLCLGCSQSKQAEHSTSETEKSTKAVDPQLQLWVGQYRGITPCVTCPTFCDGCEGSTIDLKLNQDQSFELIRTANRGNKKSETFNGKFAFNDDGKLQIQLYGVKDRNLIVWGQNYVEVINPNSRRPFDAFEDFQLEKLS